MTSPFRSWVEIDRAALHHNLQVVQKLAPKAKIIAVIKANAYGHGMTGMAKTLAPHVSYFAVASLEEALRIREVEKKIPILLLSAALHSEYAAIAEHGFIPTISSYEEAYYFSKKANAGAPIDFKINTGMNRLGAWPADAEKIMLRIVKLPLTIQSISTHLPSADSDAAYTRRQLALFKNLLPPLRALAPNASVHVLNSAGLLRFSKHAYDEVRIGLMMYGVAPIASFQKLLRPALTWKTVISLITKIPKGSGVSYGGTYQASRDLTAAILSVGYGDGYPRHVSGKGAYVLMEGKRAPIIGRVTMDQLIVDVSHIKNAKIGDTVILLGKQGRQEITATELSSKADTIAWHLFTGITERVHRVYKK